jgi:predicted metal-binding protein
MVAEGQPQFPLGFCQCGCGEITTIATRNRRGTIKGQPHLYKRGHGDRRPDSDKQKWRKDGKRYCRVCATWKEDNKSAFPAHTGYVCKACRSEQAKQRRLSPEVLAAERRNALKRRYGMSVEQYESMLELQQGVCAICSRRDAVVVDHDHRTGKVRALLCQGCNSALGNFFDDPMLIRKAASYVENHRAAVSDASEALGGEDHSFPLF